MCSYTILGLRPIENLKARKELVIRCTKGSKRSINNATNKAKVPSVDPMPDGVPDA
jgi:hypothetical protein